jgi:hypothetical protein
MRPHLYGPYRVTRRVGKIAYELELLEGIKIHIVFHVSCLKKLWVPKVTTYIELPPLDERGRMISTTKEVLDV